MRLGQRIIQLRRSGSASTSKPIFQSGLFSFFFFFFFFFVFSYMYWRVLVFITAFRAAVTLLILYQDWWKGISPLSNKSILRGFENLSLWIVHRPLAVRKFTRRTIYQNSFSVMPKWWLRSMTELTVCCFGSKMNIKMWAYQPLPRSPVVKSGLSDSLTLFVTGHCALLWLVSVFDSRSR